MKNLLAPDHKNFPRTSTRGCSTTAGSPADPTSEGHMVLLHPPAMHYTAPSPLTALTRACETRANELHDNAACGLASLTSRQSALASSSGNQHGGVGALRGS